MHECYFLNVVLLPKRTLQFYNALCVAFYHLPQPGRLPFRLLSELCKHGGMQKLCHVRIPSCLRRGQNKCSAPPAYGPGGADAKPADAEGEANLSGGVSFISLPVK